MWKILSFFLKGKITLVIILFDFQRLLVAWAFNNYHENCSYLTQYSMFCSKSEYKLIILNCIAKIILLFVGWKWSKVNLQNIVKIIGSMKRKYIFVKLNFLRKHQRKRSLGFSRTKDLIKIYFFSSDFFSSEKSIDLALALVWTFRPILIFKQPWAWRIQNFKEFF